MHDYTALLEEILSQGTVFSLGTVDTAGVWVADVNYVHKIFNIYWASHILSRHSRALERNPHVAGSITLHQSIGEGDKGLQISGLAKRIYDTREEIFSLYKTKRKKAEPFLLPEGYSWYCLEPQYIDLIYEPLFGREKKKIEVLGTFLLLRNASSAEF